MILFSSLLNFSFAQDVLIKDAYLIDARGNLGPHSLLVSEQKIAALDPKDIPEDTQIIDGSGLSILPGLIDSHTHISLTPGEAYRDDSPEEKAARHSWHMRAYLSLGVTTIVDTGITPQDAKTIRKLQETSPSPDIVFIGPLIGPKDGYPSDVIPALPGVENIAEVQKRVEEFSEFNPQGIKITMEDGFFKTIHPLFSSELQDEISEFAHQNEQNLYVHATDVKGTHRALDMKPHTLVHTPLKYNKKLAQRIAAEDVYVCSTMSISYATLETWEPTQLDNDQFQAALLPDEKEAYFDQDIKEEFVERGWETLAPDWPLWIGRLLFKEWVFRMQANQAQKMIQAVHKEGGKIVLGSDTPGWPIIPYLIHGPSTHFEIDLLYDAGFSAQEIITAATLTPAQMLGKEDSLGTLEIGKNADLLIVQGNPLQDISALHKPIWIMKSGEIHRSEEWLTIEQLQ